MKKFSLIVFIITALAIHSFAQSNREAKKQKKDARQQKISELVRQAEEGVLIYAKQNIYGLQLRTNGYGLFYEMGRMKTNRKTNIYRLDITEIKHPKEEKLNSGSFIFGNPFVYGKINNFYQVTLGFGQQYILGQKGNKNGVSVSALYNGGLSIGLLRPYYIEIKNGSEQQSIRYTVEDSALFLNSEIIGAGGIGKGWGELKVKPGIFAKAAMRFDYGRYNESVTGLEIGVSLEAYASKIPIMLLQDDKRLFYQVYVAILFGKRK